MSIKDQLAVAIGARKDSILALRGRIADLLDEIPVGVVLVDDPTRMDGGEVCRVIRVCTGASQWSNRTWDVTIKGKAWLTPSGTLLADNLAESYWDGNNMHHHSTAPTCGYAHSEPTETEYAYTSGPDTRAAAARLSAAIAAYMVKCEEQALANAAVLA